MSCSLNAGCDEAGVCYAAAMDQPDKCPRDKETPTRTFNGTLQERLDDLRELLDEVHDVQRIQENRASYTLDRINQVKREAHQKGIEIR